MRNLIAVVLMSFMAVAITADDRHVVPSEADLEKTQLTIRELYNLEYSKAKAADRLALANKLYDQGLESKNDVVARFVMLREARDLSAKAGDALATMRAAEALEKSFEFKPGAELFPTIDSLVTASTTQTQARNTAEVFLIAVDDSRAIGEWDTTLAFLKAATTAAQKSGLASLTNTARNKSKEIESIRAEEEKIKDARTLLETKPDDPAANFAVGRFLCLFRYDWAGGLPLLAKGANEKFKKAAELELNIVGTDVEQIIAAADAWYDVATTLETTLKPIAQIHAYQLYTRAQFGTEGLVKAKVDKRISELQPIADARTDRLRMWITIRRAVAEKRLQKWQIQGGSFHTKTFEDLPARGAILIGFHYNTLSGGKYPGALIPIYATQTGSEVNGTSFPGGDPGMKLLTTKAKPGYAVGAIYTRGGGGIDAIKPIYMRITEKGLDTKDSYDGPYIGGMGGGEATLGNDGNFIVGIHGKIDQKKLNITAISPITIADANNAKMPTKKKK